MVGLYQNSFCGLSKRYPLENDNNRIAIKYALENIFNGKYSYLKSFIFRINIITCEEVQKSSKKTCRKN